MGGFLRRGRKAQSGGWSVESGYNTTQHDTNKQAGYDGARTTRRPCTPMLPTPTLPCARVQPVKLAPGTEDAGHGRCSAAAAARRSAGEHRTATVLDYRLRLYTEVSTLCCRVTRAIWGENLREAGLPEMRDNRGPRSGRNRDDEDGTSRGYSTSALIFKLDLNNSVLRRRRRRNG